MPAAESGALSGGAVLVTTRHSSCRVVTRVLTEGTYSVGRAVGSTVLVDLPAVSRRQATLHVGEDVAVLRRVGGASDMWVQYGTGVIRALPVGQPVVLEPDQELHIRLLSAPLPVRPGQPMMVAEQGVQIFTVEVLPVLTKGEAPDGDPTWKLEDPVDPASLPGYEDVLIAGLGLLTGRSELALSDEVVAALHERWRGIDHSPRTVGNNITRFRARMGLPERRTVGADAVVLVAQLRGWITLAAADELLGGPGSAHRLLTAVCGPTGITLRGAEPDEAGRDTDER